MVGALGHRGPDEFGVYRDQRVALGIARLSIIDIEGGHQPMSNGGGTLWVVFNGEIYNYVELRAELMDLGHHFHTRSDTEVIVQAYEEWGTSAFERFNGQFAIAIWDAIGESLVLARDGLGIVPLYLCEHDGRILFASEIKAIFAADASIPRSLDFDGLAETFTFWTTIAPQTVFRGVSELEPGHFRTIATDGVDDQAFWALRFPPRHQEEYRASLDEAALDVRAAIEEAVRLRALRADVPVGCYISGGLDSSLLAALGSRIVGDGFKTFSIGFDDEEYDETAYQHKLVATLESDHYEVRVNRREIAESFPSVVRHAERPILRAAPTPLYLLSRLVHESGIKVVMTGEGADEMFAGYDLFRESKVRRFWGRHPESTMRPRLLERLYPYLSRSPVSDPRMAQAYFGQSRDRWAEPGFGHHIRWRSTAALQRLFTPEVRSRSGEIDVTARLLSALPSDFRSWSFLAQDQYIETRTLLSGYLLSSQGDRMLMAHSVEGRFPFLDPNVITLANSLPPSYKLSGLDEKRVLKRVAEGLVPEEIIRRPKQPYRSPDAGTFLIESPPDWVHEVIDPRAVSDAGVFEPTLVRRLWRKCQGVAKDAQLSNFDNMALVGVISSGLLHEYFVRGRPQSPSPTGFQTLVDMVAAGGKPGRNTSQTQGRLST